MAQWITARSGTSAADAAPAGRAADRCAHAAFAPDTTSPSRRGVHARSGSMQASSGHPLVRVFVQNPQNGIAVSDRRAPSASVGCFSAGAQDVPPAGHVPGRRIANVATCRRAAATVVDGPRTAEGGEPHD